MALFHYRLSSKSNQLYGCSQVMLQQVHAKVRSYSKVAPPPSPPPKAIKGDEMLRNIFLEVKNKFETAVGFFRKEKITIDPEDPAAVSHYAKVMKQVRHKAGLFSESERVKNDIQQETQDIQDARSCYLLKLKELRVECGINDDLGAEAMMMDALEKIETEIKKGMALLTAECDKINNKLAKYEDQLDMNIAKAEFQEMEKEAVEAMETQKKSLTKTKQGQINNQRVANEILDGGCEKTVLLGLILSTNVDESVNFECYDIGMESTRKREKVSNYPVLFKSPPRASIKSSMIVVGKHIYLVGGRRCTGDPFHPKEESLSDVFCIDTTQPENGWVEKAHLPTPRSSPLLVALDDNNLYCIGGGEEAPWAQLYHIKDDTWSELDVQPTGRCVELPYYVGWCALITEEKRKKIVLYGDDDSKLYCFDPDKGTCDVYDECFMNGFTNVLANLLKHSSNYGLVIPEDEYGAFSYKPAQDGDFVYFTGEFSIYCYHLLEKKWIPRLMRGFDRNTKVIPSPRPTTYTDDMWGVWQPECRMVSLGRGEFCLTWISSTYKYLYWTRFGVDVRSGTPTASRFCATRKICLPPSMWFGDIKCFAIQRRATNNPPPPSGTSDEKKKNKKKIDATSPYEKEKKKKKKIDAAPLLM